MPNDEPLIPKHGGYRNLRSFQIARLAYDVTFRFCELYVEKRGRTHDQMVQAARSGVQNIAEGSIDSATSKKSEMFLTNIARGSLEELRDDYEDFLRQRGLPEFAPNHPALIRFKKLRCATLQEVQAWVADELKHHRTDLHGPTQTNTNRKNKSDQPESPRPCPSVPVRVGPCRSVFFHPALRHPRRERRPIPHQSRQLPPQTPGRVPRRDLHRRRRLLRTPLSHPLRTAKEETRGVKIHNELILDVYRAPSQ